MKSVCLLCYSSFFFNDTATTEIYTLSLHDALPIFTHFGELTWYGRWVLGGTGNTVLREAQLGGKQSAYILSRRSEEHTSELQSRQYLVCRLLLEKKKKILNFTPLNI